jgi:hypothetical protein
MVISNTTTRGGIMQMLEDLTNTQNVSSYSTDIKLRDINLAFDDYQNMVKRIAGTWQADDTNHTKYPNATFALTSGQKDYTFTEDEQGNQIQDIYRVEVMKSDGSWKVLKYVDEMNYTKAISEIDTETGEPDEYYLTANGVFLVTAPNYTQAGGIRMFFTRSPSYFTTTDVTNETKEPGIPNAHHRYLALKPAFWYWLPKDSTRASIFQNEILKVEKEIEDEFSERPRNQRNAFTVKQVSNR